MISGAGAAVAKPVIAIRKGPSSVSLFAMEMLAFFVPSEVGAKVTVKLVVPFTGTGLDIKEASTVN
ncbi:thiol:disulfide oxidoreductase [Leptospira ryugenii]|uniref:Thiol:disulfide oxidoreductase n=1 Tax=Leptospira ryugenii TaxID=1917863 RepID=A0A2P2DV74_9LEPT|nr:thiol:disulfide oxidoreductase [Leptospira ryugenii]